jgi:hypothetical protein
MMPSNIPGIGSPGSLILLFAPRSGSTLPADYLARAGIARPREWFQETSYLNNASIAFAGPRLATCRIADLRPVRRIDLDKPSGGSDSVSLQAEPSFPDGVALRPRAGATLRLDIDAGAAVLTFLGHGWSGRVNIECAGGQIEYNLFNELWSAKAAGPEHAPREEGWLQRIVSGDPQ